MMRIAGGIILLLLGIWGLAGGGASVLCGGALSQAGDLSAEMNKAVKDAGGTVKLTPDAKKNLEDAQGTGMGLMVSGGFKMLGGLLGIIGGIMFFLNKGKMVVFIACGVTILGAILWMAMVAFGGAEIGRIVASGFCIFAATKIGADA
jgi:hypothetical protein